MSEVFDIIDQKGKPTGEIVERNVAHANGIWHRTSHVWLLRFKDNKLQILLQKRTMSKDSFPGCYDISSAGHIPAGVDFVSSALRELQEELGITARPEELILCGDRKIITDDVFHGKPFHDRQYSRVFVLWCDKDVSEFFLQPEEIDSVKWLDFNACLEAVKTNAIPHCIDVEELLLVYKTTEKRIEWD